MDYEEYRDRLQARFGSPSLAFTHDEYESRLTRLRAQMDEQGFDLLMLSEPAELCYLTGYTTFEVSVQCLLLVSAQTSVLFVPAIEIGPAVYLSRVDQVSGYAWQSPAAVADLLAAQIGKLASSARANVGISLWSNSLRPGLLEMLREKMPGVRFQDKGDLLDRLRRVKSSAELDYLAQSAKITGAGLDAAAAAIHTGAIDHHIAQAGANTMLGLGSEFMSMQPIVATGARSGIIHTNHAGHSIERGDIVFTEFGAVKQRYTAPMMRTAVVGQASAEMREFHAVCLDVLEAVMRSARSGQAFAEAARAGAAALAPSFRACTAIRSAPNFRHPGWRVRPSSPANPRRCSKTTWSFTCRSVCASRASGAWGSVRPSGSPGPALNASPPMTERCTKSIDQPRECLVRYGVLMAAYDGRSG